MEKESGKNIDSLISRIKLVDPSLNDIKEFTMSDITIHKNSPEIPYQLTGNIDDKYPVVHWCQRKLLLSEIEFFTFFWDPVKVPRPKCIYVGAADGKHIQTLSDFFPKIEFHLYDPRNFNPILKDNRKIHIYQQYFTDQDAEKWSARNDVFFISDIRTGNHLRDGMVNFERSVVKDMGDQERLYEIINPVRALLKFRFPYTQGEFDRYQ